METLLITMPLPTPDEQELQELLPTSFYLVYGPRIWILAAVIIWCIWRALEYLSSSTTTRCS